MTKAFPLQHPFADHSPPVTSSVCQTHSAHSSPRSVGNCWPGPTCAFPSWELGGGAPSLPLPASLTPGGSCPLVLPPRPGGCGPGSCPGLQLLVSQAALHFWPHLGHIHRQRQCPALSQKGLCFLKWKQWGCPQRVGVKIE